MSSNTEKGIYLFCGIQTTEKDNFGVVEIEGVTSEVFTIRYKDAAMVVAEVPLKIFHPNKDNLLFHQNTVSEVMNQKDAVIPISFGNVFRSIEDVETLLQNLYPQFQKLFPEIEGKMEVGLKVIGKKEYLESLVQENQSIMTKAESIKGKSEAASYYDRIQLGDFAQKMITKIQSQVQSEIFTPLEQTAVAAKANDPLGEKMLLNASFLIDRREEEAFDRHVNEVHEKWKDKVDFKYTGPWPAYNFVNIRLTLEENA